MPQNICYQKCLLIVNVNEINSYQICDVHDFGVLIHKHKTNKGSSCATQNSILMNAIVLEFNVISNYGVVYSYFCENNGRVTFRLKRIKAKK